MHILIVSYSYLPRLSGVAYIVDTIAKQMLIKKYADRVTVLCYNDGTLPEREVINGVNIVRFKTKSILKDRIPLLSIDFIKKMQDIISNDKIDQVHNHTRFAFSTVLSLIVSKFNRIPVIHFEHLSDHIKGEPLSITIPCYIWDQTVSRLIFTFSDRVITASKSMRTFLTEKLGANPKKTIAIENGCNYEPLAIDYDQKFKNKKFFNFLFAARFVPLKNPMLTLKAIEILASGKDNFHLYIAGDGKQKAEMLEFIESKNLGKKVTYLGKLSKEEMTQRYRETDIFLNPSYLEGFCGTVLEAIFHTCICIVTNVGGNRDIITTKQCQVELEGLTPERLALKMQWVMDYYHKVLPDIQRDKDIAVKEYRWEKVIDKIYHEVQKLLPEEAIKSLNGEEIGERRTLPGATTSSI
jgi:glycosyltransferase involved in cell wall biosynthesis